MTDREIMQQWLQPGAIVPVDTKTVRILLDALRERLAQPKQESFSPEAISATQAAWKMGYDAAKAEQPEQEPHSWYSKQVDEWMTNKTRKEHERLNSYTHKFGKFDLALYTAPPQREWQRLTDKEREEATGWSVEHIEAKLKEKNT